MMNQKNAEHNRSVQDKAYDLLGELIIEQQTKRLLKEIEEEKTRGDTAEMEAFFAKQDRINLAKIQAYSRMQKAKRLFQHTLPRIGQIAAIVIALVALAGSVAIAASDAVRVRVMQMLINIEEQYTEIKLVEDEAASFDVPAGWNGDYFPSHLPGDLELLHIGGASEVNYVEYVSIRTGTIALRFQELDRSAEAHVDTEEAALDEVAINGQNGYIVVKDSTVQIFWTDGYKYFLLATKNIGKEETLFIAESVKPVK